MQGNAPTNVPESVPSAPRVGAIQNLFGRLGAWWIRVLLQMFGKTIQKSTVPWLLGPIGPEDGEIGDRPYELVAMRENLALDTSTPDAGLVPQFDVLTGPDFDAQRTDRAVRRFYEKTGLYDLDVWSESPFPGRLFLWLIVYTVSRTMNQLNFPVFGLDLSRGMTSEVIPLRDMNANIVHTGWYRRVRESGIVVYTGFYTTVRVPAHSSPCVKVVFPLPRGAAVVVLKPGFDDRGRFTLTSAGNQFGGPGFYRLLELDQGFVKVMHLTTLKEYFTVFRDDRGELRCDHLVKFLGMTMLRLHYRMRERV